MPELQCFDYERFYQLLNEASKASSDEKFNATLALFTYFNQVDLMQIPGLASIARKYCILTLAELTVNRNKYDNTEQFMNIIHNILQKTSKFSHNDETGRSSH